MLAKIDLSLCCHRLQDDEKRDVLAAEDVEESSIFSAVLSKANRVKLH